MSFEFVRLVSGQAFLRLHQDADFLVVLMKGRIKVVKAATEGLVGGLDDESTIQAPLIVCGFNKNIKLEASALGVCEVHRLSMHSCTQLSEEFPADMKSFLDKQ